jgi:hypothetical protein
MSGQGGEGIQGGELFRGEGGKVRVREGAGLVGDDVGGAVVVEPGERNRCVEVYDPRRSRAALSPDRRGHVQVRKLEWRRTDEPFVLVLQLTPFATNTNRSPSVGGIQYCAPVIK